MGTTPGQPPQYSTTDYQLLQEFQDRMLEPRSTPPPPIVITSTMWTPDQLTAMLDYRVKRFMRETGITVARLGFDGAGQDNSVTLTPGQESVVLPQNLVDVLRLAFVNYDTSNPAVVSSIQDVPREDYLSLDAVDPNWETETAPTPYGYTRSVTQALQAFLANPPSDVGAMDLTFVAFTGPLTGLGVKLGIPPEFCMYPLYGLMADAFSVEGEAFNPNMAQYCEARFSEGIMLAKCLLDSPSFQDAEEV